MFLQLTSPLGAPVFIHVNQIAAMMVHTGKGKKVAEDGTETQETFTFTRLVLPASPNVLDVLEPPEVIAEALIKVRQESAIDMARTAQAAHIMQADAMPPMRELADLKRRR